MSNNQTQSKQIAEKQSRQIAEKQSRQIAEKQSRQLTEKQTDKSKKDKNSKNNDADNNNNSKLNGNSVSFMTDFLNVINSIIKFLPLGFYFFTYFSATIYKDLKSVFLLIGLIINDIIGYLWKKYTNGTVNSNCNMFSSAFGDSANNSGNNNANGNSNGNGNGNGNNNSGDVENDNNIYGQFMQNPHTEIVSFVASFFGADMFYKEKLDILPFTFLSITLFLTVWSMMNTNCERKFGKIITNIVFGAIRGSVYYFIIKKYYLEAEKGKLEKETCDLGYNNYRCDEIKNGTVIIKDNSSKKDNNNNNDDDEEEDDDF